MKDGSQFAVIISLDPSDQSRVARDIPLLKTHLERLSTEPLELLFRSVHADHFGYLIRSKLAAGQLLASIETPQREHLGLTNFTPPFLTTKDLVMVLSLGSDFALQTGFSRARTWLQRH